MIAARLVGDVPKARGAMSPSTIDRSTADLRRMRWTFRPVAEAPHETHARSRRMRLATGAFPPPALADLEFAIRTETENTLREAPR